MAREKLQIVSTKVDRKGAGLGAAGPGDSGGLMDKLRASNATMQSSTITSKKGGALKE